MLKSNLVFCAYNNIIFSVLGHQDSAGFSHDGKYIATADMAGLVQVWKVTNGQCIWIYECTNLEVYVE